MEYYSAIKKNTFVLVFFLLAYFTLYNRLQFHQYSILTHIYGIYKDVNDNPVCETAQEPLMYRTVFGLCGRGRGWEDLGEWH